MQSPRLLTTRAEAWREVTDARSAGKSIGLVPTMGSLHRGHLSLVDAAGAECDVTVVTVFVNPTQFGPSEDYREYPRDLDADMAVLAQHRVQLVFAPNCNEMYPPGYSTYIEPPSVASPLEGRFRPGHFRGVTTVVLKLFHTVPADVAYFGQKDYQQSLVIRRMAADLDVPITIRTCPTVREPDGLAMSSRNRYLNRKERAEARALYRGLSAASELVERGERSAAPVAERIHQVLRDGHVEHVDYVAIVDPQSLASVETIDRPVLAAVAAQIGATRLIDNLWLGASSGDAAPACREDVGRDRQLGGGTSSEENTVS
jgi:pantoate--beta-alanine ligase